MSCLKNILVEAGFKAKIYKVEACKAGVCRVRAYKARACKTRAYETKVYGVRAYEAKACKAILGFKSVRHLTTNLLK